MTKKRLEKLRKLKKEAEHIKELMDRPMSYNKMVADTAKDYSTGHPHTILLVGYGDDKRPELQQKYYDKLRRINEEIASIEDWLDSVSDPELRDILRLQYVTGLTQEQIAEELNYDRRTIQRKLKKFWES